MPVALGARRSSHSLVVIGWPVAGLLPKPHQYPSDLIASFGIDPSTTRTNGSSSPRSALCHHSMKLSAPCSRPHSKSSSALPKVAVHWPLIEFECGPEQGADNFIEWWHKADRGELDPFVLVVEGSIPNEAIKSEGYWCGFGNNPATGQPMTTSEWLDRLAPKATGILAVGTCATYGGIHAMAGNPTGAMGVPDYLG